jgi:hypothetical protein
MQKKTFNLKCLPWFGEGLPVLKLEEGVKEEEESVPNKSISYLNPCL